MRAATTTGKKHIKRDRGYYLGLAGTVLIFVLIIALFAVYPLYLRSGYNYIAAGKYFFFLNLGRFTAIVMGFFAAIYFAFWGMSDKEIKAFGPLKPLDLSVLFFALSSVISYFASPYKNVTPLMGLSGSEGALRGCAGWYMGLFTVLIMVMFYFVISRFFKYTEKFVIPVLVTAMIVTVWGLLNRFGISFLGKDGADPQYIATIGNINWYCGYLTVVIPVLLALFINKGAKARVWLSIPLAAAFAIILVNGSDSGVFALYIVFLFLFVYSSKDLTKLSVFSEEFLIFSAVDLIVSVIDKAKPELLSFHGFLGDILTDIRVAAAVFALAICLFAFCRVTCAKGRPLPGLFCKFAGKIAIALTVFVTAVLITLIIVNTKLGG
ncbi:MAG: hypothetical protein ILP13_05165, partial [Lachnospiraceae bacterium]|nr:hypothetical protein [Lachnospiraceae bacterium]